MPLICPHCQSPVEALEPNTEEVLCPACGSRFRLEHESTIAWTPSGARRSLGKFELIEMVGSGAFGTVYKARDPQLDRTVAIKVPRSGHLADRADLDRFLREARSVARLRHPAIVPVHEVGQLEDVPYLVSEFVQGLTLSDVLSARRLLPREAAALVAAVADALQYAHEQGVIHRDVTPSNILLDEAGRPHLMDFGLARRDAGDVTMTTDGQVLGTPAYMSPEQARGEGHRVDGRSDLYSLGVVLYQMLTGELPFRGTPRMLLHQVLHDEPKPPRRLNDRIPRDLETICLKAMAKEPARRYQTTRELAEDLRRFQSGELIRARRSGPLERTWRWSRRNPSLAGLMLALAMAILTGFVGVTTQWIRAERSAVAASDSAAKESKARRAAEDAEEWTGRYLYLARMNLAQQAAETDQTRRLLEVLSPYQPGTPQARLRGFEWYYWWRTCHLYEKSLDGNGGFVSALAIRPNSRTLASGSVDGKIRYWNYATGTLESTFNGHVGGVRCMAFSPDGTLLATGGIDSTIKIWTSAAGEPKYTLNAGAGPVRSVAYSPDGATLASAHADGTVRLWDTASARPEATLRGHEGRVYAVAFSPDGTTLASGGYDFTVRLWNLAARELKATLEGHSDWVRCVAFSTDGTLLASGADDFTVALWDVSKGTLKSRLKGHTVNVNTVSFSSDGSTLASSGEDATIKLWDPATARIKGTLKGHGGGISAIAFLPEGATLASASADGTVKLWNPTAVRPETVLEGQRSGIYSVAISSDSTTSASAGVDGAVMLWDLKSGSLKHTLGTGTAHARYVVFSPDGATLASAHADGTVRLWDTASARPEATLRGHASAVLALAFSPDGTTLASTSYDKTVRLWDIATGESRRTLLAPGSAVNPDPLVDQGITSASVAFSPDGATLASSNTDRGVTLWNLATGEPRFKLDSGMVNPLSMVNSVAFSLDGKTLAAAGWEGHLELWDTDTGKLRNTLKGHSVMIRSVTFCPDGKTLASAADDRTIMLWDIVTGEPKTTLKGHDGYVTSLAFSSDGTILASGSRDKTVRLWRAATEEAVLAHLK